MDEAAEVGLDESYPELLVVEYLQSEREIHQLPSS